MTDPRPRPQYGEYATPEEQAKAMGITLPSETTGKASASTPDAKPPTAAKSRAANSSAAISPVADSAATGSAATDSVVVDDAAASHADTREHSAADASGDTVADTPADASADASSDGSASAPVAEDLRARPAYGELAPLGAAPFVAPGTPATSVAESTPSSVAPSAVGGSASSTVPTNANGNATATRPRRRWDVILTAVLLGIGVVSVVNGIPQYANFADTMQAAVSQLGYGEYTAVELANTVGLAINISQVVLLIITAFVSIRLVQRGRLGFYVPLIGGFVTGVIIVILAAVALTGDPGLMSQLGTLQ